MTLRNTRLGATLAAALAMAGCAETNAHGPVDAGALSDASSAADAPDPDDAAWTADAARTADATLDPDGGIPPGGCFERAVTIWTSVAGPSSRAHGSVLGAVGDGDGWLALVTEPAVRTDELIALDREGSVRWRSAFDLPDEPSSLHRMAESLVLFATNRAIRVELDAAGITRAYPAEYVGGLTDRNERTMAVEPLRDEPGFRAISLHLDGELRQHLRVSELRPDAAADTGFVQVSARIALPADLRFEEVRAFLRDDHLWLLESSDPWRVLDVQLGLGGLGSEPMVPARVWTDETWAADPVELLDVVDDPPIAITAQIEPGTSGYVGVLETLPPAARMRSVLGAGLRLGSGFLGTATLDAGGDVVVATHAELSVFARDGTSRASTTLDGTAHEAVRLADGGREVAAVFVEGDSSDRRIAIRCMPLP